MPRNLGISLSHRVTARFGGTVNNRSKKILVALLALGSLFGISTVAAIADETSGWNIEVTVTDSTPPSCSPTITPASWMPVEPLITTDVDLMAPPPDLTFYVYLGFADGSDSCDALAVVEPTGTVTTTYTPTVSPNDLGMAMLDCVSSCQAQTLSNDGYDGRLSASPNIPSTTGTFGGRLEVVWAPVS